MIWNTSIYIFTYACILLMFCTPLIAYYIHQYNCIYICTDVKENCTSVTLDYVIILWQITRRKWTIATIFKLFMYVCTLNICIFMCTYVLSKQICPSIISCYKFKTNINLGYILNLCTLLKIMYYISIHNAIRIDTHTY